MCIRDRSVLQDLDKDLSEAEKKNLSDVLKKFTMEIKDGEWKVQHSAASPWPEFPKEQPQVEEKPKHEIYKAMLVHERQAIEDFQQKKLNQAKIFRMNFIYWLEEQLKGIVEFLNHRQMRKPNQKNKKQNNYQKLRNKFSVMFRE
eukprot:TRINITY_DN7699_c0_g1_i2.p2 TRINITY_DN7699_c0_g1~~TRINITY_DN7699_c0_g1_i2.p2  ORF type:complete len:145 (-),score=30.28 TRINITY_DN7699_c0_g1_i2:70-504(-)